VDVLDAANLPAADRNGYSDPFCKFNLNGKEVYKTKTQKKTLNPTWGENFTVTVPSRIAAKFKVMVMDWDLAGDDDDLGETKIDLEQLEPLRAKEYKLKLDRGDGTVRLRLQFKPNYVTRSRQGTGAFAGTFAAPTKLVSGVAGAPIKGVGMVGGGVARGATFLTKGFRSKKKGEDGLGSIDSEEGGSSPAPQDVPMLSVENSPSTQEHKRTRSFGQQSIHSIGGLKPNGPEVGAATISVISASGFPAGANVRVQIRQMSSRGTREVLRSKAVKSSSGQISWENETVKLHCTPDAQFQIQVKDHSLLGRDDDLGETLFFIDDSASGSGDNKTVKVGNGSVVLRSTFVPPESAGSGRNSPNPKGGAGSRRSFLHRKNERGTTPS
jgi:Ca2+-dependent lipid-binding protein